jgi:glycerol-3-phosphate O-acyltransferase / dihydroxyacetone phosphate acyltransferase
VVDVFHPSAKRLLAAWRILVGVWAPKQWDLSLAALSQYTTPETRPDNPWIDRQKTSTLNSNSSNPATTEPSTHTPSSSSTRSPPAEEPAVKTQPRRRPPSRRIVRHVLRTRVEAVKALASFFDQLERMEGARRLKASPHLAKMYGVFTHADIPEVKVEDSSIEGWRDVHEVIRFLKERGAKIPTLGPEEEWAALSTEGEGDYSTMDETEPMVWMPPSST